MGSVSTGTFKMWSIKRCLYIQVVFIGGLTVCGCHIFTTDQPSARVLLLFIVYFCTISGIFVAGSSHGWRKVISAVVGIVSELSQGTSMCE